MERKPIRAQFVTSDCEPYSLKFEICTVSNLKCKQKLAVNCHVDFNIDDIVVLVYVGSDKDYFVFRSLYAAVDFLKLNGYM